MRKYPEMPHVGFASALPTRKKCAGSLVTAVFLKVTFSLLLAAAPSLASVPEEKVKAAFVFNFVKFVTWPEGDGKTVLRIGYMGVEPLSGSLNLLDGREVQGKKIRVIRVQNLEEDACEVFFVSSAEARRISAFLTALGDRPVLTISDAPDFIQQGGMIGLVLEKKRIRFEINLAAALKAHLRISSQLLGLAREVLNTMESDP
jgi:hypothetical protein